MIDGRPLHDRVQALANRFRAQATGYRKRPDRSLQDAQNADRDTDTLAYAAIKLRSLKS